MKCKEEGMGMKWRMRILIMCLACSLGALVLQAMLFQNLSSRILHDRMEQEMEGSLRNMQNTLYAYLNAMEGNLIGIYEQNDFLQDLASGESGAQLREKYLALAQDFAFSAFETDDGVKALYLYTDDHEIISTYRWATTPKHKYPTDLHSGDQFNAEMIRSYIDSDKTGMLISSYYNPYRETEIIHLVLKIFAGYRYDYPVGYVVCDVDSSVLTNMMKKCIASSDHYVWLQPLGDRPAASIGHQDDQHLHFAQIVAGSGKLDMEEAHSAGLYAAEQSRYDLTAYCLMSQVLLRQNQQALSLSLATIAVIMILVVMVITSIVLRSMTRPLGRLTETMDKIKEGSTDLRAKIDRNDEFGSLSRNFNEMLDRLQALSAKEQEHIRLLDQAEYRTLQAQINPHFLYNTLETMAGIAEMEDCPQVSQLSYSLSKIFRYSLNTRDAFSTVSKEIEHLKNYTYIMDVRMHGQVEYRYEVDAAVLSDSVPRLSIQPLVENSLNHGLKNKAGSKIVVISAKAVEENLVISVADNGVGMDAETMNRSLAANDIRDSGKGNSIGLHNINARLKLLHGDPYGLLIESIPGEGTRVTMTLPRKKEVITDGKEI